MSLELVDVLGHDCCLLKFIPVINLWLWVNEHMRISNLECPLVILKGCPLVVDYSFSVTKKSAGSILSNPLNILKTSSKSTCSRLISRVVIFSARS